MVRFGYYGNFLSYSTETYIADALERAGHKVIRINRNSKNLVDCDYLLCSKLSTMDLITKAKKKGITSISWSFDLYRGYLGYNRHHLKADIVITTDPDDIFPTVLQAVNKPDKKEIKGEKIYDVIFVGSMYYQGRRKMIAQAKPKPKVFNNVRGLALNKLFAQTKIVLGDTYPASNCWSNRIYETSGRGGFIIHPKVINLYDYIPQFERGNVKEMNEMIKYYLEHEDEREKLRKIQFKNCPTYDDKIKEFMKIVENYGKV